MTTVLLPFYSNKLYIYKTEEQPENNFRNGEMTPKGKPGSRIDLVKEHYTKIIVTAKTQELDGRNP
jgi:hypothetical protein